MAVPHDAYRRFQEELAVLDRTAAAATGEDRLTRAKADFLALRKRYGLSVADVVGFFPENEGIEYLQQLIAEASAQPAKKRRKSQS
ncbi:MAG: 2-hydroxyacyl-CoA dehydratase [Mizugakiibacter sp.]|uniref:2-hydroxyacyl-CoA dehydratase n=1 Tax=Mizugakiibacter sp. TaxID=1972610 RepID=UPI0031BD4DF6|nr:2-hydroxyacyl-CoA dehydratase [Xanthomonadaceae bacterium]